MATIENDSADLRFWEWVALGALVLEAVALAIYSWATASFAVFGILMLMALAGCAGGAMFGFLFGVPRCATEPAAQGEFRHNSNLEQISDWLTKILVGATLVQFDKIAAAIGGIAALVGGQLGVRGGSTAAASVMIFSFFAGLMWGYLWASVRVREALVHEREGRGARIAVVAD